MPGANSRRSTTGKTPMFVKNPHPESKRTSSARAPQRSAVERERKTRTTDVTESRTSRAPRATGRGESTRQKTRGSSKLPGWKELSDSNRKEERGRPAYLTLLDAVPTFRMSIMILVAAAVITLYVGHVLATQEAMSQVESLRRENLALHLRFNRVKGAFDQASGPSVIYERAQALGLVQQVPNGSVIELN